MQIKQTVLITGASSGIGFALAKLFARDGYDLVLVAKDKTKLLEAAGNLRKDMHGILSIAIDLADPHAPEIIYKQLQEHGINIDILVNNAGFATYGLFAETDLSTELDELQVNILALTHLTKLLVRDMVKKGNGKILNLASTAAFFPGPLMAVYYASKAYVLSFSEALANELKGTGVSVSVLCPGPTNTGFVKRAHLEQAKSFKGKNMDATAVAEAGYRGLMANKPVIILGFKNRIMSRVVHMLPRTLVAAVVRKLQEQAG